MEGIDYWFPFVALFSGLFIQLALLSPQAERRIERYHPIPGSYRRMDRMSWVLITVGFLWAIQNLLA